MCQLLVVVRQTVHVNGRDRQSYMCVFECVAATACVGTLLAELLGRLVATAGTVCDWSTATQPSIRQHTLPHQ